MQYRLVLVVFLTMRQGTVQVVRAKMAHHLHSLLLLLKAAEAEAVEVLVIITMVVLVALAAWVIALNPESRVLDLVAYAWAGLGASLGPCVLYCLFWKGTTGQGLVAGMLVGGSTIFVWRNLTGGIFELYEILPAFVLATLAIYFVSRLSNPNELKQSESGG